MALKKGMIFRLFSSKVSCKSRVQSPNGRSGIMAAQPGKCLLKIDNKIKERIVEVERKLYTNINSMVVERECIEIFEFKTLKLKQ